MNARSDLVDPETPAERERLPAFESEAALWRRFASGREPAIREELLRRYMSLAASLASRYKHASEPYEDLLQVANLALVKAVERFDPERGIPFPGYAAPTIAGELKRHFRDRTWAVRVPRGIHDRALEIEKVTEELTSRLQRSPSVSEVADRLGVKREEVLEVYAANHNRRPLSLDRPLSGEDEDNPALEWIGDEDGGYQLAEGRWAVERALRSLDSREREAVRLRFEEDLTQSEIGARLGCSQMHVSRILRAALAKMRDGATVDEDG